MTRLIYADALKELKFPNGESEYATGWNDAISAIMTFQPTIEAEPVRHWKWKQTEVVHECFDIQGFKTWGVMYMCESCGFKTIAIEGHFAQYKYCPQCGARMDKDECTN